MFRVYLTDKSKASGTKWNLLFEEESKSVPKIDNTILKALTLLDMPINTPTKNSGTLYKNRVFVDYGDPWKGIVIELVN